MGAASGGGEGGGGGTRFPPSPSSTLGDASCPVPEAQRPMVEYEALSRSVLFSVAAMPVGGFVMRCLLVFGITDALLGLPIAAETYMNHGGVGGAPPFVQVIQTALAGSAASVSVLTLFVLRLYFGWSYVGERLLSASVLYEESGWYDGETWVKTDDVRERDRLVGMYQVRPIVERLRRALGVCGAAGVAGVLLLAAISSGYNEGSGTTNAMEEAARARLTGAAELGPSVSYRRAFTTQEEFQAFQRDEEAFEGIGGIAVAEGTPSVPNLDNSGQQDIDIG